METKFQTTFIPKKPMAPITPSAQRVYLVPNLFFVVALTMLVCVALVYGGAFFYKQYLNTQVKSLSSTLADKTSQINRSKIAELVNIDNKLKTGATVLREHIAPSLFFAILQSITVSGVQFKDFSLDSSRGITVALGGEAGSYGALALESDVISKNAYLKNAVFSDFSLTKSGTVLFKLGVTVDPASILYGRDFGNLQKDSTTPGAANSSGVSTSTGS